MPSDQRVPPVSPAIRSTVYAASNVQLLEHLRASDWDEAALNRVRRGYGLVQRHFSARYRGDGRPFVEHLVRTAAILFDQGASEALVLAGLTHAYYSQGDFGVQPGGLTPANRQALREAVGEEAEMLVARYGQLPWSAAAISAVIDRIHRKSSPLERCERQVLTLRICNELEEALDGALLYLAPPRRQTSLRELELSAELSRGLDWNSLADRIDEERAYYSAASEEAAHWPSDGSERDRSYVLLPPSASRRLRVRTGRITVGVRRAVQPKLRSLKHRFERLLAGSTSGETGEA